MRLLLTIDVDNTNIVFGLFNLDQGQKAPLLSHRKKILFHKSNDCSFV